MTHGHGSDCATPAAGEPSADRRDELVVEDDVYYAAAAARPLLFAGQLERVTALVRALADADLVAGRERRVEQLTATALRAVPGRAVVRIKGLAELSRYVQLQRSAARPRLVVAAGREPEHGRAPVPDVAFAGAALAGLGRNVVLMRLEDELMASMADAAGRHTVRAALAVDVPADITTEPSLFGRIVTQIALVGGRGPAAPCGGEPVAASDPVPRERGDTR